MTCLLAKVLRGVGWNIAGVLALLAVIPACSQAPQDQLTPAILRGDVKAVKELLDDPRVDVNWRTPSTGGALNDAAAYRQPNQAAIVRLLLQRGATRTIEIRAVSSVGRALDF